jgi:hypothetical protein
MRKLEEFWFKYFSRSTLNDDKTNWVRYIVYLILCIPAIIAVAADRMGRDWRVPLYIFIGLFGTFAVLWIIVWIYHKIGRAHV